MECTLFQGAGQGLAFAKYAVGMPVCRSTQDHFQKWPSGPLGKNERIQLSLAPFLHPFPIPLPYFVGSFSYQQSLLRKNKNLKLQIYVLAHIYKKKSLSVLLTYISFPFDPQIILFFNEHMLYFESFACILYQAKGIS